MIIPENIENLAELVKGPEKTVFFFTAGWCGDCNFIKPKMPEIEVENPDFTYVVPDFRLNKQLEKLNSLSESYKPKVEFLCNECCWYGCKDRKECYKSVSRQNLGIDCMDHVCKAPFSKEGYRFSRVMENPAFISLEDILNIYVPMGYSNFKIEGRDLGSALLLEFILYYMVKPQYQIHVREAMYLDAMLDLF